MKQQNGFILIGLFIAFVFLAALGIAGMQLTMSNYKISTTEKYRMRAQFGADAAVSEAIAQLKANAAWTGTSGMVVLQDTPGYKVEYSATVTQPNATTRLVNAVGNVYAPKTVATPSAVYKYEVELTGSTGSSPNYFSVASGPGGLQLSGSSTIDGGPLYINGKVTMTTGAEIGSLAPLDMYVAHQSCPTSGGSTYPLVCASGEDGQPMSLSGGSTIQGTVRATNQVTTTGLSNPGLIAGSTATAVSLPNFDRSTITGATLSTITGSAAGCSGGTRTWPANLKIIGDVFISSTCQVTIEGNIWVTGRVQMTTNTRLIVKNGLTVQPVLMVDGSSGFFISGGSGIIPNSSVTPAMGLRVIAMHSSSACTPDCTVVTGSDLRTSQSITTIDVGTGSAAAGSEFYSRWGTVNISGDGNVGSVAGQMVRLSTSANLVVDRSVVDFTPFNSAWKVKTQKRIY